MQRVSVITILLITMLFALSACKPQPKEIKLSEQDAGQTVEVRVGDVLSISLEGNPTTGYTWELDSVDTTIIRQKGEATYIPKSEEVVGSSGTITLAFEALKTGETTLRLVYHRPWEKDVPPEAVFEVAVKVK